MSACLPARFWPVEVGLLKQQLRSVLEGTRQLEAGVVACEGEGAQLENLVVCGGCQLSPLGLLIQYTPNACIQGNSVTFWDL